MSNSPRFRRFELIPTLITLVGVGMMFALGVWQLQRLEWKQNIISQVEEGMQEAPITHLFTDKDMQTAMEFRRVKLAGMFSYNEAHITPRYFRGKLGYGVLTPFLFGSAGNFSESTYILVDRGWIPAEEKSKFEALAKQAAAHEGVVIEGILRRPLGKGWFTPNNDPEKNLWFWMDMPALEKALGAKLQPMIVQMVGEQKRDVYPIPSDGKIKLRNDHLGYAITWFLIAIAGVAIFLVYHRNPTPKA